jgi:hypothetical protein
MAHTANEAEHAKYKTWVESHDVNEIRIANLARAKLRRSLGAKGTKKWPAIKDERHVKQASNAFMQFNVSRQASGDFKNIALPERAKLIGQEWKVLSDEEKLVSDSMQTTSWHLTDLKKKKYKNLAARDAERQSSEDSSVYSSA